MRTQSAIFAVGRQSAVAGLLMNSAVMAAPGEDLVMIALPEAESA
jgi:hypothetical protein